MSMLTANYVTHLQGYLWENKIFYFSVPLKVENVFLKWHKSGTKVQSTTNLETNYFNYFPNCAGRAKEYMRDWYSCALLCTVLSNRGTLVWAHYALNRLDRHNSRKLFISEPCCVMLENVSSVSRHTLHKWVSRGVSTGKKIKQFL